MLQPHQLEKSNPWQQENADFESSNEGVTVGDLSLSFEATTFWNLQQNI